MGFARLGVSDADDKVPTAAERALQNRGRKS